MEKPTASKKPDRRTEPKSEATAEPADIQFQLAGLQSEALRTSRRVRILGILAGVLALSFIGLLFYLRHNYIMQFAEVDQLEIIRSDSNTGTARIRFRPLTAGRIQFVREGGGRQETLLEYAAGPASDGVFKEFHWAGNSDGNWTISIRYRDGGSLVDREWQSSDTVAKETSDEEPMEKEADDDAVGSRLAAL